MPGPTQIDSIHDLAAVARGRRLNLGYSQAELATRARVSRQWVNEFEAGKQKAELDLVLRLLHALGLRLELLDDRSGGGARRGSSVDLDALLDRYR